MADAGFSISVGGVEQVVNRLEGISDRGKNMKPVLSKAASIIISSIKLNFISNGSRLAKFTGGGWLPRKVEPGWPILRRTSAMYGSFKANVDAEKAVIFNSDNKFAFHQLGTRRGIPARRMLGYTDKDNSDIIRVMQAFLMEGR